MGPHTHTPAPAAPGWRTPAARPVGGQSGEGERLTSDAPHNGGRHPPRGTAPRHPRGTQPPQGMQAKGTALSPHTRKPAPTARGQWTPTARPVGGQSGEGERLASDAPRNSGRHPPGDALPPPPRGAHSPKLGTGEPGPHGPPPSTPDGARDRGRTRGGARTTWNGPTSAQCRDRARCARHTTKGAKGTRGLPEGQPDRARGTHRPRGRNAQTAWNGVPASEGKGHPDGTARHTQRRTRGAGRGKRERHNTRYRPEPPEPAASSAHTWTVHCTHQGSSGALRPAPTPRLGSLRARPRGSHWRQASSTGPGAPAPRATTH